MRVPTEAERVISFPLHEFIAMVETWLTPNHPMYKYVAKHYKEQVLAQLGEGFDD